MRRLTYLEGFRSVVRRYPDRTAAITTDGRSYTFRELDERSDALAAAMEARLPGERCAVLSLNDVAVVEAMLASMKRGRANVQLSTRGAAGELAATMDTADAAGLIYHAALGETAAAIVDRRDPDVVVEI
ncbi:MAG TPA: AMP-binding protein, partial [Halobacteriales archaeon]|nr:AMP-binding protein [Halobacteriales archaeon]